MAALVALLALRLDWLQHEGPPGLLTPPYPSGAPSSTAPRMLVLLKLAAVAAGLLFLAALTQERQQEGLHAKLHSGNGESCHQVDSAACPSHCPISVPC